MNSPRATVEGKWLVMPTKTALPERCIRTNAPVSPEEYRRWDLPHIPRWLVFLMLVSPLLLIAVPFAVQRRCVFKAGLSNQARRDFFLRKSAACLLMLAPLALCLYAVVVNSEEWVLMAILLSLPCFWIGFAILILWTSPLRVIRADDQLFWIRGCSPEFLASLEQAVVHEPSGQTC